jgi:hypothetical protein
MLVCPIGCENINLGTVSVKKKLMTFGDAFLSVIEKMNSIIDLNFFYATHRMRIALAF